MDNSIKVPHPDGEGFVEFSRITLRQLDVLKKYQKLIEDEKKEKTRRGKGRKA
jgi:hypothetical protein